MRRVACLTATLLAAIDAGCGQSADPKPNYPSWAKTPPHFGPAPRYRPMPLSDRARQARPIDGQSCTRRRGDIVGSHLEILVNRLDVVVPAGIGFAPPHRTDGAEVVDGSCWYPVRTTEPTGLIEVASNFDATLGDFFDIWGQPLTRRRLLSFRGHRDHGVIAFFNGRRWHRSPRSIPLERHAKIMVELGGYVPPHPVYVFPPAL